MIWKKYLENWQKLPLCNCYAGMYGIIVGSGPSLNLIDTSLLKGPGKVVFGVNNSYPKVIPDVWVGMDDPKCYSRELYFEPFLKILRGGHQDRTIENNLTVCNLTNVAYLGTDTEYTMDIKEIFKRRLPDSVAPWYNSALFATLSVAIWTGVRQIFLVGVDLSTETSHYYTDKLKLSKPLEERANMQFAELHIMLQDTYTLGKQHGILLKSMSKNSKINEFMPYIDIETLNDRIRKDLLSKLDTKLYHCTEFQEISTFKK